MRGWQRSRWAFFVCLFCCCCWLDLFCFANQFPSSSSSPSFLPTKSKIIHPQKQEKRSQHAAKETEFLRLKRSRLGVEDFMPLKVIGRGAFGEGKTLEGKLFFKPEINQIFPSSPPPLQFVWCRRTTPGTSTRWRSSARRTCWRRSRWPTSGRSVIFSWRRITSGWWRCTTASRTRSTSISLWR